MKLSKLYVMCTYEYITMYPIIFYYNAPRKKVLILMESNLPIIPFMIVPTVFCLIHFTIYHDHKDIPYKLSDLFFCVCLLL